jgi:hypothetical protein
MPTRSTAACTARPETALPTGLINTEPGARTCCLLQVEAGGRGGRLLTRSSGGRSVGRCIRSTGAWRPGRKDAWLQGS